MTVVEEKIVELITKEGGGLGSRDIAKKLGTKSVAKELQSLKKEGVLLIRDFKGYHSGWKGRLTLDRWSTREQLTELIQQQKDPKVVSALLRHMPKPKRTAKLTEEDVWKTFTDEFEGRATTTDIAQAMGVPTSKIYTILQKFEKRGWTIGIDLQTGAASIQRGTKAVGTIVWDSSEGYTIDPEKFRKQKMGLKFLDKMRNARMAK